MTDYFNMMKDVASAYGRGQEKRRDWDYEDEKRAREKTAYEQQQEEYRRRQGMQRIEDNAFDARQGLDKGVVNGNTAGMSNASAQALSNSGGQALVDQTARLGNAEEAAYGIAPSNYQVSTPTAPTIQTRKATDREYANSDLDIATAQRSTQGMAAARGAIKKLDIDDTTKANIERSANDPAFMQEMAKHLNLKNDRAVIDNGLDEKGKRVRPQSISIIRDDGGVHKIDPSASQMKVVAKAMAHLQHNDVDTGITLLASVDKTLAEQAATQLGLNVKMFGENTKSQGEFDKTKYQEGILQNDTARLGIERARLAALNAGQNKPQFVQLVDDKGNAALFDQRSMAMDKSGQLQLPTGFKFPKQRPEIDYRAVEARAAALVGQPMPGTDKGGKKRNYDGDSAYLAAKEQLYPGHGTESPSGLPPIAPPPIEAAPAAVGAISQKPTSAPVAGMVPPVANPYFDTRGRPTGARVEGDDTSAVSRAVPAMARALTSSGDPARTAYLQGKLSRGERLDPSETARAKAMGIIQ